MPADRAAIILARFTATQSSFSSKLRNLPPGIAEDRPDARTWTPAQIGCHVAMANEWIARVLTGGTTAVERASGDFSEQFDVSALPPTEETFPDFVPPYPVSRDTALERLRASSQYVAKAIAAMTVELGTRSYVKLGFGTLSLYELADFAATHMTRHLAQVDRTISARV